MHYTSLLSSYDHPIVKKCGIMNIKKIIVEALKYPFSDWKKILIFGIIIVISSIHTISGGIELLSTNIVVFYLLGSIAFIFALLERGYLFKIVKSSLDNIIELPQFGSWIDMLIDGGKVFFVCIVYSIPVILFVLVWGAVLYVSSPSKAIEMLLSVGTWIFIGGNGIDSFIMVTGIWAFIVALYMIVLIPIIAFAIVNMAYNDKVGAAFNFKEIFNKIAVIGLLNVIKWYIVTGIVFFILYLIGFFITVSSSIFYIHNMTVGLILLSLIVFPYIYMYFVRSVALVYMSNRLS